MTLSIFSQLKLMNLKKSDFLNEIGKKSPRSLASVDELPLIFLEFYFVVSKIIIIFVA